MIKLIFCGIILVILLKILLNVLNNLTNNIKYVIKERAQKQEKLKHKEFQRQQEELKQQEILKLRQQEIKKQEELKQLEIKKQEEFKRKFPELAKYRETYREKYIEIIKKEQEQKRYTPEELEEQEYQKQVEFRKKFPEIAKYRDEMQIQKNYWDLDEVKGQLHYIDKLDNGYQFEEYIANLLKRIGYTNVKVTSGSGDNGADVLAEKNGITYAIQCKWSLYGKNNIGNKAIQEIFSGKTFYNKDRRNSCNKQLLYTVSNRNGRKMSY